MTTMQTFCSARFGSIGCEKQPNHDGGHKSGSAYWTDDETQLLAESRTKKALMNNIDAANFKEAAQTTIKQYFRKGMLLDALLWGNIIAQYDEALKNK